MKACMFDTDCIVVFDACCSGCAEDLDILIGINGRYEAMHHAFIGCEPDMSCNLCLGPADQAERSALCVAGVCEGGPVLCESANDCTAGNSCIPNSMTAPASACRNTCRYDEQCREGEVCGPSARCTAS